MSIVSLWSGIRTLSTARPASVNLTSQRPLRRSSALTYPAPRQYRTTMADSSTQPPPPLSHVLETCLYVKSMPEAAAFYKDILRLKPYLETPRMSAFAMGNTTLLLFHMGSTMKDLDSERGRIPHHGPTQRILDLLKTDADESNGTKGATNSFQQHYCLGVTELSEVVAWEAWLKDKKVKVLGTMDWERGGRSVYFEDPDGHIGEVGSKGIWEHY